MATKTSLLGLTKPAYTEAADIAVLNTNFDLIDKAVGNGKFVRNELDNSYFRDFINQRGASSTEGTWSYGIDRWICVGTAGQLVWHNSDHIALGALRGITQPLTNKYRFIGKVWTLAVMDTSGNLSVVSSMFGGDNQAVYGVQNGLEIRLYSVGNSDLAYFNVNNISSDTNLFKYLAWAALYEGAYTAETLPAYVYKGYAAELAECQRYYLHVGADSNAWIAGKYIIGWGLIVEFPVQMRTNGSVIKGDSGKIQAFSASGWEEVSASYVNVRGGTTYVCLSSPVNVSAGDSCLVMGIAGISAEL